MGEFDAAAVEGCRRSHRRLFQTLAHLDDSAARRRSRLPGWTVGHVLTHLARNADSHARMLEAAAAGEAVEQYAGGPEQRAADIDAGSSRPAAELAEDVRVSAERLEAVWAATPAEVWASGHGLSRGRVWPCAALPFARWREVEVHHVDLALGYEIDDWPDEYVARELPRVVTTIPDRLVERGARRRAVAWLIGRLSEPGSLPLESWEG